MRISNDLIRDGVPLREEAGDASKISSCSFTAARTNETCAQLSLLRGCRNGRTTPYAPYVGGSETDEQAVRSLQAVRRDSSTPLQMAARSGCCLCQGLGLAKWVFVRFRTQVTDLGEASTNWSIGRCFLFVGKLKGSQRNRAQPSWGLVLA